MCAGGLPREDPGSVPGGSWVPLHRAQHLPHLHTHDQAQATPPPRTRQGGGIIYNVYNVSNSLVIISILYLGGGSLRGAWRHPLPQLHHG